MAQELWLIMIWENGRWKIIEQHVREDDARAQRDLYRQEAPAGTVRVIHSADGV
jgi:hypothetical protein